MSDPGQEKQLGGLARSIGALFSEADSGPEVEADALGEADRPPSAGREDPAAPEPIPGDGLPARDRLDAVLHALTAAAAPASSPEADSAAPGHTESAAPALDTGAAPPQAPPPDPVVPEAEVPAPDPAIPLGAAPALAAPEDAAPAPDPSADRAAEVEALLAEVQRSTPAGPGPGTGLETSSASHGDLARRVVAELGTERDDGRREALIGACVRLGSAAAAELAAALAEADDRRGRRAYLDALVAMGPVAMPVVEKMTEDDRWYVLRNGVAILGEIGGEDALGAIVGALARPEGKVRREALIALAKIGGDDAGQLALGMLEDPDPAVRTAAARAVGELGVQRAHRRLVHMLGTEDDTDLVVAVLRALGQLGDPGAVHAIERHAVGSFLRKPPPEVRITAYRALRQIGTPHARRLLNQAVDDREPVVKQAVRQLLGMT